MTPEIKAGRWIENRRRNRSFAVVWELLAAGSAILAVVLLIIGLRSGKAGGGLFVFGLFFLPALAAARFAFGCANAGLLVTDEAVVIRNPWRRREVPVSELRRFTAGMQVAHFGNPTPGIILELNNGSAYSIWTLARDGFVWHSAKNVVALGPRAQELNALVQSSTP
jgi:hypothetical protein